MKYIVSGILLFSGICSSHADEGNAMLNSEEFKAIVQFVLDNGWNAYVHKSASRLTPIVKYKDMLIYVIPDFNTGRRENVSRYKQIIIYYGEDINPSTDLGQRFDIHQNNKNGIYIENKRMCEYDSIVSCIAMLKEMVNIERLLENINLIINKEQFETIVRFVLDNGKVEPFYSSLWGSSPCISYKGIRIYLKPDVPYFNEKYQNEMSGKVSHYKRMFIDFDAEGGRKFSLDMENGNNVDEVYIKIDNYLNRTVYENKIVSVCIPLLLEMIDRETNNE